MSGSDDQQEDDLSAAINNISARRDVVSEVALKAKEEYDQFSQNKTEQASTEFSRKTRRKLAQLDEFSENVRLLTQVFSESRFDEMVYLLANPARLFTVNLLVGLVRGIGFAIGVLLVAFLLFYLIQSSTSLSLPGLLQLLSGAAH